jgi:prophage endopeptidase
MIAALLLRFGIPRWAAIAALGALVAAAVVSLGTAAAAYHHHVYQQGWDAAVADRASHDLIAVVNRTKENATLSIKQDAINAVLTKAKNEELAPVASRIAAERVRVGAALCNGPATPAKAESAAGGDSADPPGRLVRQDVDRDIRALKLAVEEDLATGRACQRFLQENGLVP